MKFLFRRWRKQHHAAAATAEDNIGGDGHTWPAELSDDARKLLRELAAKYPHHHISSARPQPANNINLKPQHADLHSYISNMKRRLLAKKPPLPQTSDTSSTVAPPPSSKRRKSLRQHRFSRRRYLRECHGTNLPQLVIMLSLFMLVNAGTITVNAGFLLPQTAINQDVGRKSNDLARKIDQDQPRLSALLQRRQALAKQAATLFSEFTLLADIRQDFNAFTQKLNTSDAIRFIQHTMEEQDSDLPQTRTLVLTLEAESPYLNWLDHRNQMIRQHGGIHILNEAYSAPAGKNYITIQVKMAKTGRLK